MYQFLETIFSRSRTLFVLLALFIFGGLYAFVKMPKESKPDVEVVFAVVTVVHVGISPVDAERQILRPLETEMRSIEGVKEMTAAAREGRASIFLEFEVGVDSDKALTDVRAAVDLARPDLPEDSEEPEVEELSMALFPVLTVGLSGDIPTRKLMQVARNLRDEIEALPEVLKVEIAGEREEQLDVVVDPVKVETYQLSFDEVFRLIDKNNRLVPAGTLDVGSGRSQLKVQGVYETYEDLLGVPIKAVGDKVIRLPDIALVRKGFKDPKRYARISGKPGVALEVQKRPGENIIETVQRVRDIVKAEERFWPAGVQVEFFQDDSTGIQDMLKDLQNNLISAILMVMAIVIFALGARTAGLVGVAIPGSFLSGIFVLYLCGVTMNIVVLFSLILAVGMLVDGAIVVTEYADRKMQEGAKPKDAYLRASYRMFWPITASTATTLAAFMPLFFWPGIVGQFMLYMPITLSATLIASLVMALIFVPAIGRYVGRPSTIAAHSESLKHLSAEEHSSPEKLPGLMGRYLRLLKRSLNHPWRILFAMIGALILTQGLHTIFGKGVEFFPNVEPESMVVNVRMRGDLSIEEMQKLVVQVEKEILEMDGISAVYSTTNVEEPGLGGDAPQDAHGEIFLELADWETRTDANGIIAELRRRVLPIPGVIVEVVKEKAGPDQGKPIVIDVSSRFPEKIEPVVKEIRSHMAGMPELVEVEDSLPVPGIEWQFTVNRVQAARFGADVESFSKVLQLATTGARVSRYRPNDTDEEVDIRVRFPDAYRNLSELQRLKVPTNAGLIPVTNFVKMEPVPKLTTISRVDGRRTTRVRAGVKEGFLADDQVKKLQKWVNEEADFDPSVRVEFKGEDRDQQEASEFLQKAFFVAILLIAAILLTQFNSFYRTFLVLTAVVFSTTGVFLGLLITNQAFSIVMNGIGVIALAGIVVNNNIVLIDTYARLREDYPCKEAVLMTCAQRLRPVMLTTITTILGLMPMVLKMNIDFLTLNVSVGAPSTQWWAQLATSVVFGLAFSTAITLLLTPSLLVLGDQMSQRFGKLKNAQN